MTKMESPGTPLTGSASRIAVDNGISMPPPDRANLHYGSGIFRRRVRLVNQPGRVCAELEDCCHGFRLHLAHDGEHVTAVAAEALRFPLSTCDEVNLPLQALVGCRLTAGWGEFTRRLPPAANCTHLVDLAWWSMAHARRDEVARDYEVSVTDEDDKPAECAIWRNGELMYRWYVARGTVVAPQELSDRPMLQGFNAWAARRFKDDEFEAAVMLQRSYFIMPTRRYDYRTFAGKHAALVFPIRDVCYSYSAGALERATVPPDCQRDFTHTPELLLEFV